MTPSESRRMIVTWVVRNGGPLAGLLLGVAVAFAGFGAPYVFATSTFWEYPPTDFSSHLIGYRAYVHDSWHYPLFQIDSINEPTGINLIFMDGLPPVAVLAKLLRAVVPSFLATIRWNPLGVWQVMSYGLQGFFAALVVRTAGQPSRIAQVCGSAFVVTLSGFVLRFYHTALNSHFLILAAFWLYLGTRGSRASVRRGAYWVALLVVTLLVHPYLFVMVSAILTATLVTWLTAGRFRVAALTMLAASIAIVGLCAVTGFLGARAVSGAAWGFGFKSTDIASFVVPQYSTFFPSRAHRLAIDMTRDEASEGWSFLGCGLIVLGVLLLIRAPRAIARTTRSHLALVSVLVLMAAWAIGNRVTFAQHVMFELPMPQSLNWFVGQLRSSGRFIWPITYAAALSAVVLGFRTFRNGMAVAITPILAFVQLVDGFGNFAYVRGYTSRGEFRFLDHTSWLPLLAPHTGVTVGPSFECVRWPHDRIAYSSLELQYLGAARGLALGNVRSSRPSTDCTRSDAARVREVPDADRLVVLFPPMTPPAERLHYERLGLGCTGFVGGYACSRHISSTSPPPGFTALPDIAPYTPGTVLAVASEEASRFIGAGWSYGEGDHRCQTGEAGFVHLRLSRPLAPTSVLHLAAGAPIIPRLRPTGTLDVIVNDVPVRHVDFTVGGLLELVIPLPASLAGATLVDIELRPGDWRSPKALGEGGEERPIGLVVRDLSIE